MNDIEVAEAIELELIEATPAPAPDEVITEQQDIWDYLVANIDEFAVAKAIVDHFDANPKDFSKSDVSELDLLGVYIRAKVTVKRNQVGYAQTQAALAKARDESRSVAGIAKAFTGFVRSVRCAVQANPAPVVVGLCLALMYVLR